MLPYCTATVLPTFFKKMACTNVTGALSTSYMLKRITLGSYLQFACCYSGFYTFENVIDTQEKDVLLMQIILKYTDKSSIWQSYVCKSLLAIYYRNAMQCQKVKYTW